MTTASVIFTPASVQALAHAQGVTLSLEEAEQVLAYILEQPLTISPDEALRLALAAIRAYQASQRGVSHDTNGVTA